MAIAHTKPQKFAYDFWRRFHRTAVFIVIAAQILTLIAVAALLHYVGFFQQNPIGYIATLIAQTVLGVIASTFLYAFIAKPLKDMMAAVMHISGEPTTSTPPNPNSGFYARTGFKDVLQTIYNLASASTGSSNQGETHQSSEVLDAALNTTACGIVILGHDRTVQYANNKAPVDIQRDGSSAVRLLFGTSNTLEEWLDDCDANAVHAERTWSRIPDRLPEQEGRRLYDVVASYDKGSKYEVVLTLIDRTSLYEVGEEELDFIAFAAHELRGPITVIRGYLDVLQDELQPVLADDQKELFRRLTVSANRLTGYVNNILNTSRYDRRHLRIRLHEISLASVYETIRDDMDMRAVAQGRLLSVAIPEELPKIAGDTASLSEVFSNLIDNAIKYSNEGGAINVTAAVKGSTVEVAVEDHGIGMPGSVVGNLFNKFYRSHRSRETVAGTGIGLYISKALVESHGGTITVQSEEGHGSTFTVTLPTYASVADKLQSGHNSNEGLIEQGSGWISNHSMYRG